MCFYCILVPSAPINTGPCIAINSANIKPLNTLARHLLIQVAFFIHLCQNILH